MANDYTLNWSNNSLKSPITLPGGTQDATSTSLTLTGKGSINWGEPLQENLLHLLENFASTSEPSNATLGQLWYNSTKETLFVCIAEATMGSPAIWSAVYAVNMVSSAAAPTSPAVGQFWFDVNTLVLKHWSGTAWTPIYSATSLTTEIEPTSPANGQLWYKPSLKRMYIYNGTAWVYLFTGDAISSATAPATPVTGALWFDTANNTLKIYDNTNVFVPVSNSANIIFDGTYFILNAPLKVYGVVIARGFLYEYETLFTFTSSTTVNFGLGNLFAGTLDANATVTLSGTHPGHYQLRVIQDAVGGRSITWQNVAGWLGSATAPDLQSSPNGVTFLNFFRTQGGLWYGQLVRVGV